MIQSVSFGNDQCDEKKFRELSPGAITHQIYCRIADKFNGQVYLYIEETISNNYVFP